MLHQDAMAAGRWSGGLVEMESRVLLCGVVFGDSDVPALPKKEVASRQRGCKARARRPTVLAHIKNFGK
jgi:hypothetical protein